ncbi:OB-fold domain-containing protein [soil metagenome]
MPSAVLNVADFTDEIHPEPVYQALLDKGVFAYQRCDVSADAFFPPRWLCPVCGSDKYTWERSAGEGTVYSATTLSPRNKEPYVVGLIDVDEGFRLMSNVVGLPVEDVTIGMRVSVQFKDVEDRGAIPQFVKVDA